MPRRSSKRKDTDPNVIACQTVQQATGQLAAKSPSEPPKKRAEIAKKAAKARWAGRESRKK